MHIVHPHRRRCEYVQQLDAPPEDVFPLLCPVREREWVAGWEPGLVVSESGIAETGCAFTTPDGTSSSGEQREATWVVVAHEPSECRVAFVKVSPRFLVTRVWISVLPGERARTSRARVIYEYTALGPDGDAFVDAQTPERWTAFMREWERELNEHLRRSPPGAGGTPSVS